MLLEWILWGVSMYGLGYSKGGVRMKEQLEIGQKYTEKLQEAYNNRQAGPGWQRYNEPGQGL